MDSDEELSLARARRNFSNRNEEGNQASLISPPVDGCMISGLFFPRDPDLIVRNPQMLINDKLGGASSREFIQSARSLLADDARFMKKKKPE